MQLTQADAEAIALQHAGFTADEVKRLHTDYDIDDGVPKYEVLFYQGYWEYEYDIHSETGVIISIDTDD